MKTILFTALFALTVAAQAQPERPEISANIYENGRVNIEFNGQKAKQLFEAMPRKSQLTEKENCFPGLVIKVQGGLVCRFIPIEDNPEGSYDCTLKLSALTGKTIEWKNRTDICPDDDP